MSDTGYPAPPQDRRALLHNALQALEEMQSKLAAVESARTEPIAIVGMGCRFPGGASDPEAYWQLLRGGIDAISEVPARVREAAGSLGLGGEPVGKDTPWYGGFLDNVDGFDPNFFGISPREAAAMDPQQRLALEVSWEAIERSGHAPQKLAGTLTGVFLGITTNDYGQLARLGGPTQMDVYTATGTALNAAAGRVAYTLGLHGPCMAIDTACSSSLVAVHLACQSLRARESDLALAGGVNVLLTPEPFVCFAKWGMMAPDGRCKTFDARADGFVRGEGCGMIVLKRLSDAVAADDNILAIIRGSAVNQDGRSSGLTVPNGPAQQAVIRTALANAGVKPADISYVEAHGTGTSLGDPIEVEALGAVLGEGRGPESPLTLGAVKTNIGHLESASGIAGIIKVVLSLQHGEIPPHLHLHERSPRIAWPSFPVVIPAAVTPWPESARRLAGVSAF
ncbi:MAG: type I polyketide synthase, partial [Chloroflexota bacterium]